MPLFRRSDGDLVRDESPVRRFMPYIMPTRNGSAAYHEQVIDVGAARAFLAAHNEGRDDDERATLFHLFLWCCGRALQERSQLDRFVVGRRLYQRKHPSLSFSAKTRFADDAPITTVKLNVLAEEPFAAFVGRVRGALAEARSGRKSVSDKELGLALALPGVVTRGVVWALRWLDAHNLLPGAMIESDPLYASMFVANLGSVGLSRTYHHLYEWGTISVFAAMGRAESVTVLEEDGSVRRRERLEVRWTLDERVTDGFYAAKSLEMVRRTMQDPAPQG